MKHIRLPLTEADIAALQAGDEVLLSGPLYTARDAAHQRLCRCLQEGKPLPVELAGETIYYVGPSPAKPGEVIGSAGPTTSYRMDPYTPPLLALAPRVLLLSRTTAPSRPTTRSSTTRTKGNNHEQGR